MDKLFKIGAIREYGKFRYHVTRFVLLSIILPIINYSSLRHWSWEFTYKTK